MRRRDFLAGASVLCPGLFSPPVFARDDEPGDDRGRNRGRGGRDDGPDDRGGGSSSGHGSAEERSVIFGDSRADRSEARLREDIKENDFREHELAREAPRQSGDGLRAGGPRSADDRSIAQRDGLSRLVGDVLDLFRARE